MKNHNRTLGKALLFAILVILLAGTSAQAYVLFGYSGAPVTYTIGSSNIYSFTVAGAQGGSGHSDFGGWGALVSGQVYLAAGTQLGIVVGAMGSSGNFGASGGGGGGSFVYVIGATDPLFVAGGGGGAGFCCGTPGGLGQTTTSGQNGFGVNGGAAGANGLGGTGGSLGVGDNGGGGAGWFGNGADGIGGGPCTGGGDSGNGGLGPPTFAGGPGGGPNPPCSNGGFGGGGGGGIRGGGGGGGYSGGGGGDGINAGGGGGGGSYLGSLVLNGMITGGANPDIGYITLTEVPEPGTFLMLGTAFGGMAGVLHCKLKIRRAFSIVAKAGASRSGFSVGRSLCWWGIQGRLSRRG